MFDDFALRMRGMIFFIAITMYLISLGCKAWATEETQRLTQEQIGQPQSFWPPDMIPHPHPPQPQNEPNPDDPSDPRNWS